MIRRMGTKQHTDVLSKDIGLLSNHIITTQPHDEGESPQRAEESDDNSERHEGPATQLERVRDPKTGGDCARQHGSADGERERAHKQPDTEAERPDDLDVLLANQVLAERDEGDRRRALDERAEVREREDRAAVEVRVGGHVGEEDPVAQHDRACIGSGGRDGASDDESEADADAEEESLCRAEAMLLCLGVGRKRELVDIESRVGKRVVLRNRLVGEARETRHAWNATIS
ncbi:hypothetical protein OH77DRAFT_856368 [Trametes cingulata]|nr:hypothetical protein OH77DRAFT_856368 [Trametes cingulata]